MKRVFAVVIIILSLSIVNGVASANPDFNFSDIENHWGKEAIQWALENGVANGYPDGTFLPNKPVSEAEFLAMLLNAFPNTKLEIENTPNNGSIWYENYYTVARKYRVKHINEANADKPISRVLAALMIANSAGKNYNRDGAVAFLYENDLSNGRTSKTLRGFDYEGYLTRAEAVTFIKLLNDKKMNERFLITQSFNTEINPRAVLYQPIIMPKPGVIQAPTYTEIQALLEKKQNGYTLFPDDNPRAAFIVRQNGSVRVSFNINPNFSEISVLAHGADDETHQLIQDILQLYGFEVSNLKRDITNKNNSGKNAGIPEKFTYGNYEATIWFQAMGVIIDMKKKK